MRQSSTKTPIRAGSSVMRSKVAGIGSSSGTVRLKDAPATSPRRMRWWPTSSVRRRRKGSPSPVVGRAASGQHVGEVVRGDLFQLVSEADFIRQLAGESITDVGHIERALKAKATRTGRVSARIIDDMLAGIILIDTCGAAVGKCNGLTVLEVGDSAFGMPARISATVYPGGSGIVDIEREVNLGQPIHSKGVMILTGYLGSRYAQEFPLEISASIALEQSYGYVDGDSASLGECCALISALSRTPLKQCFAITGSINQFGEVQAVGGVNEKIEGFFRLCEARGLTGEQGVIIPFANVTTLMLDERVLEAVRQQRFHVYAVRQVDEALSLLVGEDVGAANEQGHFPKGSVNARVVERLRDIAEIELEEEGKGETAVAPEQEAAKSEGSS